MDTLTMRPLGTREVLGSVLSLYRRHFALFAGIMALPCLADAAFRLALPLVLGAAARNLTSGCLVGLVAVAAAPLVSLSVSAISQGASLVALADLYLGRRPTVGRSLARVGPRFIGLMILMFLVGLATGLAALLLIVPGIIVAVMWSLAVPAAVFEGCLFFDATSRSADLTSGHRWRVFAVQLTWLALAAAVTAAVGGLDYLLFGPQPKTPALALTARAVFGVAASYLQEVILGPLFTISGAVLYFDLRMVKEGFDQARLAAEWGEQPDAAASPTT